MKTMAIPRDLQDSIFIFLNPNEFFLINKYFLNKSQDPKYWQQILMPLMPQRSPPFDFQIAFFIAYMPYIKKHFQQREKLSPENLQPFLSICSELKVKKEVPSWFYFSILFSAVSRVQPPDKQRPTRSWFGGNSTLSLTGNRQIADYYLNTQESQNKKQILFRN